jgi:hypothetical protein
MLKNLTFCIVLSFAVLVSHAQINHPNCCDRSTELWPTNQNVPATSAFLIDFCEDNYKLKDQFKKLIFKAVTPSGKRYRLKIVEANFSGKMGQFLLKPRRPIKIGDTVSIKVYRRNGDSLTGKLHEFDWSVNYKKWVSRFKPDHTAPVWNKPPIYSHWDHKDYLSRHYSIEINFDASDNSRHVDYTTGNYDWLPLYLRVELDGQRFICSADHTVPSIDKGSCGGNFDFELNRTYVAKIRIVDVSGNFSETVEAISFVTKTRFAD